ncbi:transcriptional regulator [Dysgonomonas sp. Marseille-P4677]|uniref:DUF6377 domain-containing protein n=1 Tax=Dysgonomonas sp. Marseille-P4677 TaxID=2364790 RepID=UPI00191215F8|nr:DUF6377 domain-containing protein [Dysgonomonas sp. Marseille-P4677]MBK5721339.1 transcriptional regulator [Dysgonomonas sp. Marseille-P4677]
MRIRLFVLLLLTIFSNIVSAQSTLDSLLLQLDKSIDESKLYSDRRNNRIEELKERVRITQPYSIELYDLNMQLFKEYKPYVCDSAILYLNKNVVIAEKLNDNERLCETKLQLSYLLGSSGMYKEAVDVLESVDRKKLPSHFIIDYYDTHYHLYGEMAFYTQDRSTSHRYRQIADAYKDSLLTVLPQGSDLLLTMQETAYRDAGKNKEARKINDIRLSRAAFGTPEYSMVTYHRALSYRNEGDKEQEKHYFALSALSDIHAAIKDHASLWMLAELLSEDGEIEHAYRYMRFSWSETMFYNARLRSLQSAGILSLIDKTYQAMIEKQNHQLRNYVILISVLCIMLIAAAGYIYRQMKRLAVARNNLEDVNKQLKELNEELKETNICLQTTNLDLSESNEIKEEYIGRFIKLCSTYIDKLDAYRRMVNKKISDGKTADLLKITRSQDALEDEVKELYINFDSAFLQLFPDFVNKFNALLKENDPIVLKKGELLNTELRIFALIRLGIDDSSQIAEFLRYSVNTIYNYRAKVKNRARVVRDDFESLVKAIR